MARGAGLKNTRTAGRVSGGMGGAHGCQSNREADCWNDGHDPLPFLAHQGAQIVSNFFDGHVGLHQQPQPPERIEDENLP